MEQPYPFSERKRKSFRSGECEKGKREGETVLGLIPKTAKSWAPRTQNVLGAQDILFSVFNK